MIFASENFRRILRNFLSINLLQVSNYIIPLIILPYIVRVFGVEKFGLVSIVQAFTMYFVSIAEYGFTLVAVREIAASKADKQKLTTIFSSVILLRVVLAFFCIAIITMLVFNIGYLSANYELYLFAAGIILGSAMFPEFFFQGIERMGFITVITVSMRILFIGAMFLFIHTPEDYKLYIVLLSITQLLIGVTGIIVSVFLFKAGFTIPQLQTLKEYIRRGFTVFSSKVGISIYTHSPVFILGIFAGETAAGIFSAADKIRIALQGIVVNLANSSYPAAVRVLNEGKQKFSHFIKNILTMSVMIGIILFAVMYFFSDLIVGVLLGSNFAESAGLLRILSLLMVLISVGLVFSILTVLASGRDNLFRNIIFIGLVIQLILLFALIPPLKAAGAAISIVIMEFVIMLLFIYVSKKKIFSELNLYETPGYSIDDNIQ